MLRSVTRRVTFKSCGTGVGKSLLFFSGQEVELPSGREAEFSARRSTPDLPPFLSKLLGKTSKLQIFS